MNLYAQLLVNLSAALKIFFLQDISHSVIKSLRSLHDYIKPPILSFRASGARHGIQYFQYVLDTGLRRYDGADSKLSYYDTVSARE